MKPGGPLMYPQQGYENPGPTPNLRGVEENTNMSKGTENPEQHGSAGDISDYVHDPGMGEAGNQRGRQGEGGPSAASERTADKSTKMAPPEPDPAGVRK